MGTVHGLLTWYIRQCGSKIGELLTSNYVSFSELLKMYKICQVHHNLWWRCNGNFVDVFRLTQVDFVLKVSCIIVPQCGVALWKHSLLLVLTRWCSRKIMEVEDSLFMTICALVFTPSLAVFAVLGNGIVLGIIARFKKLCTFPNILIANLALADFFNPIINILALRGPES